MSTHIYLFHKLLGELLLDRTNFNIMTRYISSVDNLKLMMNLLRDESRSIQFEAFHVFKVFVANPNKAKGIVDILLKNQEKLVSFLGKFHTDRSDDEQFNEEKTFLIKQVQALQPPSNWDDLISIYMALDNKILDFISAMGDWKLNVCMNPSFFPRREKTPFFLYKFPPSKNRFQTGFVWQKWSVSSYYSFVSNCLVIWATGASWKKDQSMPLF